MAKYIWGNGTNTPDPITNAKLNQNVDYAEELANAAAILGGQFAQNPDTTAALVFGYKGGNFRSDNVITDIVDGTVALTDDTTNYVEVAAAGVTANTTGFTSGKAPLFEITTADGAIDTVTDKRAWVTPNVAGITAITATAPITATGTTSKTIGISAATTSAAGSMSAADKTKLNGIATSATANQTNAYLLNRANHTGTQTASTISDFVTAARDALENTIGAPVQTIADLRAVAAADRADKQQRFVEDVGSTGATYAFNAEGTGVDDGDLIIVPTSGTGRWFKISAGGALLIDNNLSDLADAGAARGNLGLGNVNNTADVDKPVSTATQNAINAVASSRIYNEIPSGTVNGVNSIFTTASNYVSNSTALYLNGVRQLLNTDYSETGVNEITFITAPGVSATLMIDYTKSI